MIMYSIYLTGLFEMACEAFGGVDILFNNAGMLQDRAWGQEVDVNVVCMTSVPSLAAISYKFYLNLEFHMWHETINKLNFSIFILILRVNTFNIMFHALMGRFQLE